MDEQAVKSVGKREKKPISGRIPEIDIIRGIAVFFMMFDHFMFDVWGLLPFVFAEFPYDGTLWQKFVLLAVDYWQWGVREVIRYVIVFAFLALTGICCSFSKNNLKRGIKLAAAALGLSLVTFIVGRIIGDDTAFISFGILHAIAFTLIIVGLTEKIGTNEFVYLAVGVVSTAVGIYFLAKKPVYTYYGTENFFVLVFKQAVGLIECGGDSAGIFFNGGQIFIGVFIGKTLYKGKKSLFKAKYPLKNPVCFVGRHSLIFYLAHQAVIPALLILIVFCCGYRI